MHRILSDVMLLLALVASTVLSQQITTAPEPSAVRQALHRRQASSSSLDFNVFGSALACQHDASGCKGQLTLYDACKAEYGSDYKYLYCLCTTGYYEAAHDCDLCSVSRGGLETTYFTWVTSRDSERCASRSSDYGPNGTMSGVGASTTSITMMQTRVVSASTTSTDDMLSGLTGRPTDPPSGTASTSGPASGDGVRSFDRLATVATLCSVLQILAMVMA